MKQVKVDHCFMRDMYAIDEVADVFGANYDNKLYNRKVENYDYRDPDENCLALYKEIKKLFLEPVYSDAIIENDPNSSKQLVIYLDKEKNLRFSSDYLGPSATAAWYAGLEDEYVWKSILKCRTIGGHIMWPRIRGGINSSKAASGSRGYGISDRADIALFELKNYLNDIDEVCCYNRVLRNSFYLPENKLWFNDKKIFGCNPNRKFESFCDFFALKGSFVDEEYNIIWFSDPEREKITYDIAKEYFEKNIIAVENRNIILEKKQL